MTSKQEQIQQRIADSPDGQVFVPSDFLDIADRKTVKSALSRLESQGSIKRLLRGIYTRPYFSKLLNEEIDPAPDKVVDAIARTNRWTVVPSGVTALNSLGLSTQVPVRYEYVSSGPYKEYGYNGYQIVLKHRAQRDFFDDPKLYRVMLIIQGLKALGANGIDTTTLDQLNDTLSGDDIQKLYESTQYGTSWIFEVAKKLKERRQHGRHRKALQSGT